MKIQCFFVNSCKQFKNIFKTVQNTIFSKVTRSIPFGTKSCYVLRRGKKSGSGFEGVGWSYPPSPLIILSYVDRALKRKTLRKLIVGFQSPLSRFENIFPTDLTLHVVG